MSKGQISISFKLHMTINEINIALLIDCHEQSLLSVCNNFWLRSDVDLSNDEEEICYYEHSKRMFCGRYTVTTFMRREDKVM